MEIVEKSSNNMNDFNMINANLEYFGISAEKKILLYSVLAAILNVGNIKFDTCASNDEQCSIPDESQEILNNVALLLGVNKAELEDALTTRTMEVLNSQIRYIYIFTRPSSILVEKS